MLSCMLQCCLPRSEHRSNLVHVLVIRLVLWMFTCHACSPSPSLALEGTRLLLSTRTCHHHYAQQRSLDSPGFLPWLITPCISVCSSVVFPVSPLIVVKCSCPDAVPVPFHVRQLLNLHSLYLLLISCIDPSRWLPHEAGWENVQSCHQGKIGYFEESQL